ncbi:Flp pilus assembly protein CpaB [Parvibaculum sp.]|uniref:Flp pilus assembly protein CpaB n=1 Tax=Parvibaculum sp. TaxID=2024848 RepID=UPI002B9FA739|nr:Flp pilus assembly protein CpaB [Parvibaculum sp.]HUD52980.1 Flp pilus assembly protein CpaB [Parvibaculum sp.]
MNGARIGVLILAIVAAGLAALLARGLVSSKPEPVEVAVAVPTKEVLVASTNIDRGVKITPGVLRWQSWPASAPLAPELITKDARPDAIGMLTGNITRSSITNGEPIVEAKLVDLKNGGFMSALIAPGKRAVAISIAPETSAGGFILPNDRVDVILTRKVGETESSGGAEGIAGETILSNVRVLAVDQRFKEDGDQVAIGKTATLELTPTQAENIAVAQAQGNISLALRSLANAEQTDVDPDTAKTEGATVRVVRYGVEKIVRVR